MLTRSPVPARSSNASPSAFHAFHYAPAAAAAAVPSPHQSPRAPTASSRHPSSSSSLPSATAAAAMTPPPPKTPSQPRPGKYVAVDAATQYSPMEPVDYTAPRRPAAALATKTPSVPPPDPDPEATTLGDEDGEPSSQPRRGSGSPPCQEQPQMFKASPPMSPNKRRNSEAAPGGLAVASASSAAAQRNEAQSKRARPDTPPPKVLPERYELCPVEDMVVLIANMLSELIETNDALALKSGHLTRFHSRTAPGISVLDYLHRLAKHATLSPPLLLSMVYYIDRLCALYPDFTINTLTVHRFLITAATVAAKGLSDSFWNNSTYARVGGVRVAELKLLELEFLYRVDWKIVPNPEVLVAYYRGLVERSPAYVLPGEEEGDEVGGEGDEEDEEPDELGGESNQNNQSAPQDAPSPMEEGRGNG